MESDRSSDFIKILIVDDEEDVFNVTKYALFDYSYYGRPLELFYANTILKAKELLLENRDFALVLLDIVMDEQNSGLELIKFIREDLKNRLIQIVIRTGQPGIAPARDVIVRYDINDYKDKAELTAEKLFTILTTSIRAYFHLKELEDLKNNLEIKIQERTRELAELNATLEQRVVDEIEKRKEQEQLLIQQQKMASMGEMIGIIAHQWKQPLTIISLEAHSLKETFLHNSFKQDEVIESAKTILNQANFMSELIDNVRKFMVPSKKKEIFDIKSTIESVISLCSPLFKKLQIEVLKECKNIDCNESLLIYGYQNELKHAILNIVINAKDAIVQKMEKTSFSAFIKFEIEADDNSILLGISDNGGGIKEEHLDKIFKQDFSTKGDKGTGIGLFMTKAIIEKNMDGNIRVNNTNDGVRFLIKLKRKRF